MFDNLFTNSPAVWGGLIGGMIALPILIHLINLMRHKTVKWAAMEFLLTSHKKNRNWVWLKQLLLLLSRMVALILALLMLGQIGCNEDRISRLLGGATTHHYILLDDSFSMGESSNGGSAFDHARTTISLIGARAKNRPNQLFSVLRFSRARSSMPDSTESALSSVGGVGENGVDSTIRETELNGELVDNRFDQRLEEIRARLKVSSLAIGPQDALETVKQLIDMRTNENSILYVLSDFRQRNWENVADLEPVLADIHQSGAAIELINCATEPVSQNLALTELQPVGNVRVAGTPMMMKVTVKNCSQTIAEKVQVKLGSLTFPEPTSSTVAEEVRPEVVEIPTVFIQDIAPGYSETRSFPVYFNTAGQHVVWGTLPEDTVKADNERFHSIEISKAAKILLVDDAQRLHSRFMSLAINPGGMTGIEPEFRTKDFLRDTSVDVLLTYDVLFLLDVDWLDESAIENIESFAAAGGGVVFFLGPRTNLDAYTTSLYRGGEGVFPMPLGNSIDVPEQLSDRVADIAAQDHPVFTPVLGGKNSLLNLVQISRIIQPAIEWNVQNEIDVTVAATVRGFQDWPLVVEKPFGRGRVMVFTTTAGPIWNNWTRNATFPAIMLLMEDYLAAGKYVGEARVVGSSIGIDVSADEYSPNLTVVTPVDGDGSRLVNQTRMQVPATAPHRLVTTLGMQFQSDGMRETDFPGIYDVWFRRMDSTQQVQRFAMNVNTSESEMELANPQKFLSDLASSKPALVDWNQFSPEPRQRTASSLSRFLLLLLVATLVTEQMLGYAASYHQKV